MIRPAKQTDACALGEIYCKGWQQGYAGLMPQFFLDALTPANCAPKPDHIAPDRRLIAEVNDKAVGTITFGKGRDADDDNSGEVYSLYVLPEVWRTGQGRALFLNAVEALNAAGYREVYLWTLQDNVRARLFFEGVGMTATGKRRELEIAGVYLPELQYCISL